MSKKKILSIIILFTIFILNITPCFVLGANNTTRTIVASQLIRNAKDITSIRMNTTTLQSLINQVSASGGGTISIPAGTYYFAALQTDFLDSGGYGCRSVISCKNNVTIQGAGQNSTILKPLDTPCFTGIYLNYKEHEDRNGTKTYVTANDLPVDMFNYFSKDHGNAPLKNAHFKDFTINSNEAWGKVFNSRGKRIYDFRI